MTNSVPERGSVSIFAPNSRTGRKGGGRRAHKRGDKGTGMMSHSAKWQDVASLLGMCHHPRPFATPFTARTALCRKTAHFLAAKPRSGTKPGRFRLKRGLARKKTPGRLYPTPLKAPSRVPERGLVAKKRAFARTARPHRRLYSRNGKRKRREIAEFGRALQPL